MIPELPGRRRRTGVVLIVVLVVVAMTSLAAYSFVATLRTENESAHMAADHLIAGQIQESARVYISKWLGRTRRQRLEMLANNEFFVQHVSYLGSDIDDLGGTFHIMSPQMARDDDRITMTHGMEPESAKLHLETILRWESETPGAGRAALLMLPGMSESTADSILDWIDADSTPREFGAESDHYAQLAHSCVPRNGLPDRLEELLLVQGVTRLALFGKMNGVPREELAADSTAPAVDIENAESAIPWERLLTVSSAEKNVDFDGLPRIDINRSDLVELHHELTVRLSAEWADFIVACRQFGVGTQSASSTGRIPIELTTPSSFTFSTPGQLFDAVVEVTVGDDEYQFASPWNSSSGGEAEKMVHWLDQLTVHAEPRIAGRIDVNMAPREVLLAIPGMSREAVERILDSRRGTAETRRGLTWLVTEKILTPAQVIRLFPYLTGSGDVYHCFVVATVAGSPIVKVRECMLDGTGRHVRALWTKDREVPEAIRWMAGRTSNGSPRDKSDARSVPLQRMRVDPDRFRSGSVQ